MISYDTFLNERTSQRAERAEEFLCFIYYFFLGVFFLFCFFYYDLLAEIYLRLNLI